MCVFSHSNAHIELGLSGIICRRLGNDLCIRLIEKFEDFDGKSCEALIIIAPEHRIGKK